jgi:hypothetical protein
MDKESGSGAVLSLGQMKILTMSGNLLLLTSDKVGEENYLFAINLSDSDQTHAISTGAFPSAIGIELKDSDFALPAAEMKFSAKAYDGGYFSVGEGLDTMLYQVHDMSITSVGKTPDLLFTYNGALYFKTSFESILLRKETINSAGTEVSLAVYETDSITVGDLFLRSRLGFSGSILSATQDSTGKTYMFSISQDLHSFVATALKDPSKDGFLNGVYLTDTPVHWEDTALMWYSFDKKAWIEVTQVQFAERVGSILSSGMPSFDQLTTKYDYLTVVASSVTPFSTFEEATYFRLNQLKPVI